jgi:hypothetical protein
MYLHIACILKKKQYCNQTKIEKSKKMFGFVFQAEKLKGEICESPKYKQLRSHSPGKTVGDEQRVQVLKFLFF